MTRARDAADQINRVNSSAANATAITIDSSENVLVGQSSSTQPGVGNTTDGFAIREDGLFFSSSSAGRTGTFARNGSDGPILGFYKDGSTVGSIGVGNTNRPYIGSGDTGIMFDANNNAIYPWNTSTNNVPASDQVDLGYDATGLKFKDLYLSGGVFLGGTGSNNKLDDYEEGTWTPAFNNVTVSYTERYGKYTKIGDTVHLWGYIVVSSINNSDTSYVNVGGMPFTSTGGFVNGSFYNGSGNASLLTTTTLGAAWTVVSQNYFYLGIPSSTNNLSYAQACNSTGRFWFSMTYPTAS